MPLRKRGASPAPDLLRLPLDLLLHGFADPGRELHLPLAGGPHDFALEIPEVDHDPALAGDLLLVGLLGAERSEESDDVTGAERKANDPSKG